MKRLLIMLILSIGWAPLVYSSSCRYFSPQSNDCEFYQCLEEKYNCGQDGYPLDYGLRYCKRFSSLNTGHTTNVLGLNLSDKGVKWRDFTLKCLQDQLVPTLFEQEINSCSTVKTLGFKTHAGCYTSGPVPICSLPISDWTTIATTVRAQDYFSKEAVDQVLEVIINCGYQLVDEYNELDMQDKLGYRIFKTSYSKNTPEPAITSATRKSEIIQKLNFIYQLEQQKEQK